VTKRLIQLGTPNGGSEISDFKESALDLLTWAMNGMVFMKPYIPVLSYLGKWVGKAVFKTLDQMRPGSGFLQELNPPNKVMPVAVRYDVIAGDTSQIEAPMLEDDPIWKKFAACITYRGKYMLADRLVFKGKPNDVAVTTESMATVPGGLAAEKVHAVACDHLRYFVDKNSLKQLENLIKG
jgi:hypothetical protein